MEDGLQNGGPSSCECTSGPGSPEEVIGIFRKLICIYLQMNTMSA